VRAATGPISTCGSTDMPDMCGSTRSGSSFGPLFGAGLGARSPLADCQTKSSTVPGMRSLSVQTAPTRSKPTVANSRSDGTLPSVTPAKTPTSESSLIRRTDSATAAVASPWPFHAGSVMT
jgi:hypothetical protein